jgi:hypothetical protein
MPTNKSVSSCGRMSRNQYELAAAPHSASPAPNDEPQWRRATSKATAKTATRRPRFAHATSCGSISQASQ